MSRRNEIRSSWQARLSGKAAGWLVRLLAMTLRKKIEYRCAGPDLGGPAIGCLWHNRVIGGVAASRELRRHHEAVVLTSASKDGAVLEAAMKVFGLGAVRGSSSRRGTAALMAMKQAIEEGKGVCITPDGPRGPVYRLQAGIVKLASMTQVPVIPFLVNYESYWQLKSWDGFQIPKPFSKMTVVFGEEFRVAPDLRDEELEVERKRLEEVMREGLNVAEDDGD